MPQPTHDPDDLAPTTTSGGPQRQPNMDDANALATAASQAATDATSQEDARRAAETAMRETASERGFELSDSDVQRIAAGMIAALEARGAFDPPPPPPAPAATVETVSVTTEESSEPNTQTDTIQTEHDSAPPRKRTFADRFMGRD